MQQYLPNYIAESQVEIEPEWKRGNMAELKIEHITGKAAIAIINDRFQAIAQ